MELEDMSGRIPAYGWNFEAGQKGFPTDLACVNVTGILRRRRDGVAMDVNHIETVLDRLGDVVRLIPESFCPTPWRLFYLDAWVARLSIPALRQFVLNVLGDDSLAFLFVSVPASLKHHHNHPSGLLQHSLECVQLVSHFRQFSREQLELGMVAALFHDIGKVLTLTREMQRTSLGRTVDHDKLTLEVLAPHLQWLDRQWPQAGTDLRYLLTWGKGRGDGTIPRLTVAEAVRTADRISAGLDVKGA
ncbi:hypothetical protein B5V00_08550 [Geothermobacter hydrogeniphilus]|uniref:HD domain-containing protein n=2 Tax=Geothermobacter hydrogeniphilus TaxID=1969733 RepID=A0A1X0Y522_9BACT|nr:hypothetical protein B5V00_08550 [Geothermobacter hydrogeniphilus]